MRSLPGIFPTLFLGLLGLASAPAAYPFSVVNATTLQSDGSAADTQAAINAVANGHTVLLPAGTFTWSTSVAISGKAVKLQGAGASKVLGRSLSSVAFGASGTKTFTTTVPGLALNAGDTLRIYRMGGELNANQGFGTGNGIWMDATVTSYSGTTLVVNVTSASPTGSGSYAVWSIATLPPARTVLVNNTAGRLLSITEATAGSPELAGITFQPGTSPDYEVGMFPTSSGNPILIHDCFFEVPTSNSGAIECQANSGVIWNCSFVAPSFSGAPLAFHHKAPFLAAASWATASTMGAADLTGKSNLYIEDCWFVGFVIATDADDGAREVIRYCHLDHAGLGTHGADTGSPAYGVRHLECYYSTFYHVNQGSASPGCNFLFYIRGGTFAITDNIMPDLDTGGYWGAKAEVNMTIQNLTRGDGSFPFWGNGTPGNQIPAPRQVGYGNPTGASTQLDPLSVAVLGVSEPGYLWNNTGGYDVGVTDYQTPSGTQDSTANYVVAGRDYFNNAGAKPGYTKYTYPHPLRGGTIAPSNAVITITVE